jgi:hypothetical protein
MLSTILVEASQKCRLKYIVIKKKTDGGDTLITVIYDTKPRWLIKMKVKN